LGQLLRTCKAIHLGRIVAWFAGRAAYGQLLRSAIVVCADIYTILFHFFLVKAVVVYDLGIKNMTLRRLRAKHKVNEGINRCHGKDAMPLPRAKVKPNATHT
jgi:hypothetical protein